MRTMAKHLKTRPFSPEVSHGFVIDRVRDDLLEGRYVERIEYTETVIDPFGVELSFDRIEFRQSSFRATTSGAGLELLDPPRSIQSLLNRLSESTDFEVAITPLNVSVLEWSKEFQEIANLSLMVDSLQINELELEPGIRAKVIVKGDRDVRTACSSLTSRRDFSVEKLQLRLSSPKSGVIILGNSCTASLGVDDPEDRLLQAIRDSLRNCTF